MIFQSNFRKNFIITLLIIVSNFSLVLGGTFDNVLKAIFYTQNDSSYLILHESFYNPTSGSYEKGNLRSQGYNTSRISVYELKSGRLLVQKNMGIMDNSEACFILGCSPNNLWLYSNKYKSGLQSLNPLTLENNISQATIYKNINISIGRFIDPEWQHIKNYYGYDPVQEKLIITNSNFQLFYIDANTFATQPIKDKINLPFELNKYVNESAIFKDSLCTLDGYDQMRIKCGDSISTAPTFLYGKFILDQNYLHLFKHFYNDYEKLTLLKELANSINPIPESSMLDVMIKNSRNNIENLINGNKPDEVLLQTDSNSFYIISKNKNTPDAFIKISKIKSEQMGRYTEEWSASPSGMFYNVAQARNTLLFKQYFGDISPEFNYQFIQAFNNKIIVIYLCQICCIDINTGNISWQFILK